MTLASPLKLTQRARLCQGRREQFRRAEHDELNCFPHLVITVPAICVRAEELQRCTSLLSSTRLLSPERSIFVPFAIPTAY